MHLVFYSSDPAHLQALSTFLTVLILVGAGRGFLSLLIDVLRLVSRPDPARTPTRET